MAASLRQILGEIKLAAGGDPTAVETVPRKTGGFNPTRSLLDPVLTEGERIQEKTEAELKRIPNNIDKAVTSLKGEVQDIFSQAFDLLPGSGFIKFVGIGIVALIGLSILRRVAR